MKSLQALLFVALALLLIAATAYSNPDTSVSFSQSSTDTATARRPYDLDRSAAVVAVGKYNIGMPKPGRSAPLDPGTYSCRAWISFSVDRVTGGAEYTVTSEGRAVVRAGVEGRGFVYVSAGAATKSNTGTVAAPTGGTGVAEFTRGNTVYVTITSCTSFPCSVTATYSGGGGRPSKATVVV